MATLGSLLVVVACQDDEPSLESAPADTEPLPWEGRTRGGAIVLSRDERVAVMTSRSAGVVSVFQLDPDAPLEQLVTGRTELDFGAGSEPWAAVISPDGGTAYVISRRDKTVTRIVGLREQPELDGSVAVGSEPTAIAIAPSGKRLFVANWGEGTVSVVTTPDFGETDPDTLDLNEALAATGVLGNAAPRLGLAHPRALALTDDGDEDDGDETLFVTEFFSMPFPDAGRVEEPGYFDHNRQGLVYPIALADRGRVGAPIAIAPVFDTGLADANGAVTGCFPNQLYAAATYGERLYVTSLCASPVGPLGPVPAPAPASPANFKTVMHPVLFAIDTGTYEELPEERLVLSSELEQRYASDEALELRMPLIPNDLAFGPAAESDAQAPRSRCLTAMGADAVFCIGPEGDIGAPGERYIDLAPRGQRAARLPIGIAISQRSGYALVASDNTQTLSLLDLASNAVIKREDPIQLARAQEVRDAPATAGRRLFATGLDVWSFNGEARVSCEGCHPDGLSDGVTWFFARGPRRTLSTAGTYFGDGERRVLLWTGNVDEVHDVEGIVRSVAGGVGAVLWNYPGSGATNALRIVYDGSAAPPAPGKPTSTLRHNLNASVAELLDPATAEPICDADSAICDRSPVREWDEMDAYIRSVRAPLRPAGLDSAQVERGAELFRLGRCASCHGGPGWTLSRVFYTPGAAENGALPYQRPAEVTDEQLGQLRTATYSVPPELRPLNPPGASGTATFRRWDPPADRDRVVHLYGTEADDGYDSRKTHGGDQINCVLRAVGTFPSQAAGENNEGVVPAGSTTVVRELRDNMMTLALGATGFNIPSLTGVAAGAPYFHAGNARNLEELFDPAFAAHHQALTPGFLAEGSEDRDAQVSDLIAYLLSIDDSKPIMDPQPDDDLCVP